MHSSPVLLQCFGVSFSIHYTEPMTHFLKADCEPLQQYYASLSPLKLPWQQQKKQLGII